MFHTFLSTASQRFKTPLRTDPNVSKVHGTIQKDRSLGAIARIQKYRDLIQKDHGTGPFDFSEVPTEKMTTTPTLPLNKHKTNKEHQGKREALPYYTFFPGGITVEYKEIADLFVSAPRYFWIIAMKSQRDR